MKSRGRAFQALIFAVFLATFSGLRANAAALATDLGIETLVWSNRLSAAVVGSPALSIDSAVLYVGTVSRRFYGIDTESGEELWSVRLPASPTSSPVLDDDGAIYVGCANGVLYRITEDDDGVGQLDPLFHSFLGGRISSPAVDDDGNVYAGTSGNHLFALRPDGSKIWVYNSSNDVRVPVIADDGIFVVSGGFIRGIALDDGGQNSEFTPRAAINSTPALGDDGTLYFGANDERVYALNAGGTTNDWKFNTQKNVMSSPAVGADGSIYIASDNLRLYRFNSNGVPTVWTNRVITRAPIRSAISLGADGTVYAGCDDGRMYAFSADTGEVLWTVKTRGAIRSSAVVDAKGVVYFASGRSVYAVGNNLTEEMDEPAWQMFRKDRQHTARATLSLQVTNRPVISRQPTNLTVSVGDTASFSVRVLSASPVHYQWYFNSNAISSITNLTATNATLTISNVTTTNAGFYFVVASNSVGSATSIVARLTVTSTNGAPRIDQAPTNQTAATGATVIFSVMASGAQPLSYQWRFNTQPIGPTVNPTATNTTLTLTNVTLGNSGYYDVVITNSLGSVMSAPVELTVTTNVAVTTNALVITQQPVNLVVGEGTSATFSLVATGSPAPSFQWYFSTNAISAGANPTAVTSNLLLINVQGSAAGFYFAVASNVAGAVTSSLAGLTVTNATTVWFPTGTNSTGTPISNAPPFIVQNPTNRTVASSNDVTFSVVADGARPLFYQWYVNNTAVDATNNATATNAVFTLTNVQGPRIIRVMVSNSVGTVTSSNAFLAVTNSGGINPGFTDAQPLSLRLGAAELATDGLLIDVVGAANGRRLVLEYKDDLGDPEWKSLSTNDASGLKVIDPLPPADRSRFYRVRSE